MSKLEELFIFEIARISQFPGFFLENFEKYSSKYQLFGEHTHGFKTQVCISTNADTQGKLNFNMI